MTVGFTRNGRPPGFCQRGLRELGRVDDATQRARLAMDATALKWTVGERKDAVRRANDGSYYDTEPLTPGTQPPPEVKAPQGKGRKPGRVLVQFGSDEHRLDGGGHDRDEAGAQGAGEGGAGGAQGAVCGFGEGVEIAPAIAWRIVGLAVVAKVEPARAS